MEKASTCRPCSTTAWSCCLSPMTCRHRNFAGWRIATKVDAWVKLFVTIAYVWNQRPNASSSWVGEDCHYFSWPKSVAQNSMINFQWKRFVRVGFNAAAQIDLNGRLLSSYDSLGIGIQTPALANCSKLSNTCELDRWDDSNLIQFQQKSQINKQLGFISCQHNGRGQHLYEMKAYLFPTKKQQANSGTSAAT